MSAAVCVAVDPAASAVYADPTCSQSLVLVDADSYAAMAQNPLLMPMDFAWAVGPAIAVLFATAFCMRELRKALD
jgi:hypothetical protein